MMSRLFSDDAGEKRVQLERGGNTGKMKAESQESPENYAWARDFACNYEPGI